MLLPGKQNISLPAFPRSDEMKNPKLPSYEKPAEKMIPDARNFH
jgi:hypothetical protein